MKVTHLKITVTLAPSRKVGKGIKEVRVKLVE